MIESDGMEYFQRIIYPKLGTVNENGKLIWNYGDMFIIPEFHFAVRGSYIERRKISLRNEERLKIFYEEILTLINSEIEYD